MRTLKRAAQSHKKLPKEDAVPTRQTMAITLVPPPCRAQARGCQSDPRPASVTFTLSPKGLYGEVIAYAESGFNVKRGVRRPYLHSFTPESSFQWQEMNSRQPDGRWSCRGLPGLSLLNLPLACPQCGLVLRRRNAHGRRPTEQWGQQS